MGLLVSNKPFEFFQLVEDSEVTLVLLPTFIDVVFYDETLEVVTGCSSVCPVVTGSKNFEQVHLAA